MHSRHAFGRGTTPAGGAFGKLSFNNQLGSKFIVKVISATISYPLGGQIGIVIEPASAGGTVINFTKEYMDSAWANIDPIVDIRFDNSGGLAGHNSRIYYPPNIPYTTTYENLILRPGFRFHMEALDVNQEYSCALQWIEIPTK